MPPPRSCVLLPNINELIPTWMAACCRSGGATARASPSAAPAQRRVALMGVRQKFQRTRLGPGLALAVNSCGSKHIGRARNRQRRNVVDPREQRRHAQHHRNHRRARFEAISAVRKEPDRGNSVTAEQTFTAVVLAGERASPSTDPLASAAALQVKCSCRSPAFPSSSAWSIPSSDALASIAACWWVPTRRPSAQNRGSAPASNPAHGHGSRRPKVRRPARAPRSTRSAPKGRSCSRPPITPSSRRKYSISSAPPR